MKRDLLHKSLELSTEIHQLIRELPEEKQSETTEQVKTLSLTVQSHLVRGQKQDPEELKNSLELAKNSLSELETQLLDTVKQRSLKKMTINPVLAQMGILDAEIDGLMKTIR